MGFIREEDIIRRKTKIAKPDIVLEKYDMYYVIFQMKSGTEKIVRVFCEKGAFPNFKSEEFKKLQNKYGIDVAFDFFAKRLIGQNGLMNKEQRDDFIYLGGDIGKNTYLGNRFCIQSNGKTGQQNFDDNLFGLKLQVKAKENAPEDNQKHNNDGKTYVIGDIHGMYGSYMDIMKKLTVNDHLIILGDVIDRGTGGIQIIQDIMRRKQDRQNNPQITFMLGNHEMQFLETVSTMVRRNLSSEDLVTIMQRKSARSQMGYYSLYKDPDSKREYERWKREFDKYESKYQSLIQSKHLNESELKNISIWLNSNKGNTTIFDYLNKALVKGLSEQKAIYLFLCQSYVVLPQNIKGKDYLFVHSMPPKDIQMIYNMKKSRKGYKFNELKISQCEFMLQERDFSTYEQAKKIGFTTICGHTPELGTIIRDKDKGFIRIDAGCGYKRKKSKLALYCVDDDRVEYYDEKETSNDMQQI